MFFLLSVCLNFDTQAVTQERKVVESSLWCQNIWLYSPKQGTDFEHSSHRISSLNLKNNEKNRIVTWDAIKMSKFDRQVCIKKLHLSLNILIQTVRLQKKLPEFRNFFLLFSPILFMFA